MMPLKDITNITLNRLNNDIDNESVHYKVDVDGNNHAIINVLWNQNPMPVFAILLMQGVHGDLKVSIKHMNPSVNNMAGMPLKLAGEILETIDLAVN